VSNGPLPQPSKNTMQKPANLTPLVTIYVTKFALSRGILTYQDNILGRCGGYPIAFDGDGGRGFVARKGEWHGTKKAAVAKAMRMRGKAIKSIKSELSKLQYKLTKLEKLTFND
jgi:hypothetical protein